jgi:TolB-like protein
MAGLYEELKRRNVFRVALAYAIVAWLVLQIGDTLAPALLLPEWANTLVAFFLILGFPIALFFAWAFELTPEGLRKETEVNSSESISQLTNRRLDFIIIGVLVVALGYFAVDKYVLVEPAVGKITDQLLRADSPRNSIAVLPFVNVSDDPGNEHFSDGLSEEILNLLARIPDLKVIGRTSSFAFKGKNEDLRVIGQALDVNMVLEGSIRKSGERLRITAQLIEVSDASHIWSESYDRTMTDVLRCRKMWRQPSSMLCGFMSSKYPPAGALPKVRKPIHCFSEPGRCLMHSRVENPSIFFYVRRNSIRILQKPENSWRLAIGSRVERVLPWTRRKGFVTKLPPKRSQSTRILLLRVPWSSLQVLMTGSSRAPLIYS